MPTKAKQPSQAFPTYEKRVRDLVAEHRSLKDEPLHLAVYFDPGRDAGDVFVFEVLEGFGGNRVDDQQELFEFAYPATAAFPLGVGHQLRLTLTSPTELQIAIKGNWPAVAELRDAIRAHKSIKLFADPVGQKLWEKLK